MMVSILASFLPTTFMHHTFWPFLSPQYLKQTTMYTKFPPVKHIYVFQIRDLPQSALLACGRECAESSWFNQPKCLNEELNCYILFVCTRRGNVSLRHRYKYAVFYVLVKISKVLHSALDLLPTICYFLICSSLTQLNQLSCFWKCIMY